jgi:prepilin-type N-terminal cleavage/methylation domain-containing protein
MKWLRCLGGRERGVTLIELLVAIPIAGLVAAAAAGTIVQLLNTNDISAGMLAVRQVQIAGDWVSRDGVQAQSADNISDNISTGVGMPFTLKWSYWDTGATPEVNETHQVTYSLVNMPSGSLKRLQRHEVVKDKGGATISDTTITVAEYIDGSATSCVWEWANGKRQPSFIFKIKAVVGQKTESRSYQVRPRALA